MRSSKDLFDSALGPGRGLSAEQQRGLLLRAIERGDPAPILEALRAVSMRHTHSAQLLRALADWSLREARDKQRVDTQEFLRIVGAPADLSRMQHAVFVQAEYERLCSIYEQGDVVEDNLFYGAAPLQRQVLVEVAADWASRNGSALARHLASDKLAADLQAKPLRVEQWRDALVASLCSSPPHNPYSDLDYQFMVQSLCATLIEMFAPLDPEKGPLAKGRFSNRFGRVISGTVSGRD